MSEAKCDVGMIGLGVMGGNLALNLADHGHTVAGYSRNADEAQQLKAQNARIVPASDLRDFVAKLAKPRRIIVLVNAGAPVDSVLEGLDPLLESGDVVVDAGNSLFRDTDARLARAKDKPYRFVGMGVSGGSEGARRGPSMMPGGPPEAYEILRPMLESIAARSDQGTCVTWCGHASAGHFVKMVHNGIEYGDMQLIAETAMLLRQGLGLSGTRAADVFLRWNDGELESFLIEITAKILRVEDPKQPGKLLVDAILDAAEQKGTGRWTVIAAAELGTPIPTIAAAVDARGLSSQKALRVKAESLLGARVDEAPLAIEVQDLEHALYAAKIASYAQGFAMMRAASDERGYGTKLDEIARIWTAGCIIRARFLARIREAFTGNKDVPSLALTPSFARELRDKRPALRRVVAAASAAGFPVPGFAVSLAWLDTLATASGTANVIQAQRDFFGSHTYRRVDAPDTAVHTDWTKGS